jgi:CRISPR/Cas system CSM-associated protein Csm3 (group 7 of RAMP superfamily)
MIKVKVINLPKENLTSEKLENIINKFVMEEKPDEIIQLDFNSEFGFLTIIYKKI